jgi:Domain of Unknown Function (DUF326)
MPAVEFGKYLQGAREQYHACIEACLECLVACEVCSDACLDEPNVREMVRCIRLDRDCAEACALAARVMARGHEGVAEACRFCARLCDACADECEKHDHDHCRRCAEICRRCAEECRKMAA